MPHRLLVRSDELDEVRRILARSGYDPGQMLTAAFAERVGAKLNPLGA